MGLSGRVREALSEVDIPVSEDFFGGNAAEYLAFAIADDKGAVFADNGPVFGVVQLKVHYFLPAAKNYTENKRRIRKALYNAGATWPEVTALTEDDGKTRHLIFECELEDEEDES